MTDGTNTSSLRLTFLDRVPREGIWYGIEGRDAEDVLNQWNAHGRWCQYDPDEFRQALLDTFDPDGIKLPASEEDILDAVVQGAPESLRLERGSRSPAMRIADAARRVIGAAVRS